MLHCKAQSSKGKQGKSISVKLKNLQIKYIGLAEIAPDPPVFL